MATLAEIRRRRTVDYVKLKTQIRENNEEVLATAIPGDMLEFPRCAFSHWGIYSGEGNVIHKTGVEGCMASQSHHICSCSGQRYDKSIVTEEDALFVAGNSKIEINNYMDDKMKPYRKQKIVQNARDKITKPSYDLYEDSKHRTPDPGYNLLYENCEHFATECRYGESRSRQVFRVVGTGLLIAGLILFGLIIGVAYVIIKSRA